MVVSLDEHPTTFQATPLNLPRDAPPDKHFESAKKLRTKVNRVGKLFERLESALFRQSMPNDPIHERKAVAQ